MSAGTGRPAQSAGGEFRVGSEAPVDPAEAHCDAPWPGAWEHRAQRRPRCALPSGHPGPHRVEEAGFDQRCRCYTWSDEGDERVEPC